MYTKGAGEVGPNLVNSSQALMQDDVILDDPV